MNRELTYRIITSVFLLAGAFFFILLGQILFGIVNFLIALIAYAEWSKMNYKFYYLKNRSKNRKTHYSIIKILGFFYLFFYLSTSLLFRGDSFESAIFFITILCVCIFSDIGGYIFGRIIGGKKLTKISPNKTIAGSIGSFVFSIFPLLLVNLQNYIIINLDFSFKSILFCLTISLFCQLGDLFISFFKRLNKVKDTGKILPGHGGILDRIDGIILAIPLAWILKVTQIF